MNSGPRDRIAGGRKTGLGLLSIGDPTQRHGELVAGDAECLCAAFYPLGTTVKFSWNQPAESR
jgi:hypothetical protein